MPESYGIPDPLREKARRWEEAWGVPGLMESVSIEFSSRYAGDVPDPRGGIRWVIPERAPYWEEE